MTRRRVLLADVKRTVVALSPVAASGMTVEAIRLLTDAAAIPIVQSTARTIWITRDRLPDIDAVAEMRSIVVQRRNR